MNTRFIKTKQWTVKNLLNEFSLLVQKPQFLPQELKKKEEVKTGVCVISVRISLRVE